MTKPTEQSREPKEQGEESDHERVMFFGISAARLRSRVRWASLIMIVSFLIPFEVIGTVPIFAWDVIGEMHLASAFALLALPLAGIVMGLGLLLTRRGSSLAFLVLGALVSALVVRRLGADRAAWDFVRASDAFVTRPAGAILALALTAAAANLRFRPSTRKVVPWVLGAAGVSALYFYAWPERGEAPFSTTFRTLKLIFEVDDFRFKIGLAMIVLLTTWPLAIVLSGTSLLRFTPSKDESWLAITANWGFSLWMFVMSMRILMAQQAGIALFAYVVSVFVFLASTVLVSSAVVVAVESFFVAHGDEVPTRNPNSWGDDDVFAAAAVDKPAAKPAARRLGLVPRHAAAMAGGAIVVLSVVQAILARPPQKGTEWALTNQSEATDQLFGPTFDTWARARRRWDLAVREKPGAEARVDVKNAGKELVKAAGGIDAGLGKAFEELVEGCEDLDMSGRKWSRLIAAVNEASRLAKLPYYIDPDFFMKEENRELRYHFYAHVYRIEKVHQYDVDGDPYATLLVKRLDLSDAEHFRLGFSRDEQPFALVNVDSTRSSGTEMANLALAGRCTNDWDVHPKMWGGLERCGTLLSDVASQDETVLGAAVTSATERHELQHQIDGPHLPLCGPVLDLLSGYDPVSQDRVNRETSAYLAELTTPGVGPKLSLVRLAQHILVGFDRGVYAKTAIVVFEALAGRTIRRNGYVDGERFWPAYERLFELSDSALRERARDAWEELFDTPLIEPKLQ